LLICWQSDQEISPDKKHQQYTNNNKSGEAKTKTLTSITNYKMLFFTLLHFIIVVFGQHICISSEANEYGWCDIGGVI